MKTGRLPEELFQVSFFFCLVFLPKGAVSPHTWSPIAESFLQSYIKLLLENSSWSLFYVPTFLDCNTIEGGEGGGAVFPSKYPLSNALHM